MSDDNKLVAAILATALLDKEIVNGDGSLQDKAKAAIDLFEVCLAEINARKPEAKTTVSNIPFMGR